ncbi:MAG: ATP-binding protein [Ferruginibacter sp.]
MKLSTQILLAFSIVLILSVIDTASNYLLSVKVEQNTEFLNKSQEIIRNSGRLHKSMIEMQSSFRGYLLTQDSTFLEGYENGLKNIPALFSEQRELVKQNKDQLFILDSINTMHAQWTNYTHTLINSRKNAMGINDSNFTYNKLFENSLKKQVGKRLNDSIAEKFLLFDKIEYKIRNLHSNNLTSSIQYTHTFSFTFFALTIIIGILSTVYIISLISKRIKTMVQLAENISKGKFTTLNDNKMDELTSLSASLNIMSGNLRKNINELENRNSELDKFAYVVSHDLKAPIRGIHNVVTWIEEDLITELSPQMKQYLDLILQRTRRMEHLINGLLEYARTREKNIPERVDINEMINEIIETIVPRDFKVDIKKMPVIFTEKLKLEQVFTNLISNSVKYSQRPDGEIMIGYTELPAHFEFFVSDNGIGIDAEYHEKIFEMFQTLREKNEKESTGIGLAIIKKIVDDQQCTIRVHSTLGSGARFIFTWPKNK